MRGEDVVMSECMVTGGHYVQAFPMCTHNVHHTCR